MKGRGWLWAVAAILALAPAAYAAPVLLMMNTAQWWRNCATLDLDFLNNRYFMNTNTTCNGTGGTAYSTIASAIAGTGATFSRAGTVTVTSTSPSFHADAGQGQSWVSRTAATNNITPSRVAGIFGDAGQSFVSRATTAYGLNATAPFYLVTGQAWSSRASTATYYDSAGTLQTAASGAARSNAYYYNGSSWVLGGTLVEPASTNLVRNSTLAGAATGTPGTMPTNWAMGGITTGMSYSIVGTGTANGVNYMDIQFSGTNNSGAVTYINVLYEGASAISAATGDTFSNSVSAALLSGTPPTGMYVAWYHRDAANGGLGYTATDVPRTLTSSLQRYSYTWTIPFADVASIVPFVFFTVQPGDATNFRLRIAAPQVEKKNFATSFIPTSGSTATRVADAYAQHAAGYFNASGVLNWANNDVARSAAYYWNGAAWVAGGGALLEPAATNGIRNSTGQGTVPGQPGTAPTYWSVQSTNAGILTQVVGNGTENGIPYTDVRFYGTATAAGALRVYFDGYTAASQGQFWTFSAYHKLVGGSFANLTGPAFIIDEVNSGGTYLSNTNSSFAAPTSAGLGTQRPSFTTVVREATVSRISPYYLMNYNNGAVVNVTVRLGLPQLEQSVTATSPIPTGSGSVTRAADVFGQQTATHYSSTGQLRYPAGNTERLDYSYNGSTWVSEGALIEPARTNLVADSLGGTGAGPCASCDSRLVPSSTVAPDGQNMFWKCREGVTAGATCRWNFTTPTISASTTYTVSVYAKAAERNVFTMLAADNNGVASTIVNLSAGTSTVCSATLSTQTAIENVGNGVYRVSMTFTTTAGITDLYFDFRMSNVTNPSNCVGGSNYTVGGVNGILFWGMQLEQGNEASSYIPTNGAAATRAADVYTAQAGATYYDSNGIIRTAAANTPRMEYDPETLRPRGILIEQIRVNYITNSQQFSSNSAISVTNNYATAPDGTKTAARLLETTSNGRHYAPAYATVTANTVYSYSVFVKAAGRDFAYFYGGKAGSPYTRGGMLVNLTDGTFTNDDVGPPTSVVNRKVEKLPNGWYRVMMGVQIDASSTDGYMEIGACTSGGTIGTNCGGTGDPSKGIYAWGSQIEWGYSPGSYIPTFGATVTRPSEIFTIPTGSWHVAGQGTLVGEGMYPFTPGPSPTYPFIVSLDDGSASNAMGLMVSSNSTTVYRPTAEMVSTAYSNYVGQSSVNYVPGMPFNIITAFQANAQAGAYNGQAFTTLSGPRTGVPTFTRLNVGAGRGLGNGLFWNGWITRLTYFPSVQPDASLTDYTR